MELKDIPIAERDNYAIDEDCKLNASAGSGKTTQILRRATEGIDKYDLTPDEYTFCTYRTELADELYQEMKDKNYIDDNTRRSDTFIGTIHGISKRLLEAEGELPSNTEFVTDKHRKEFCETQNIDYNSSKYDKSEGEKLFERLNYLYNVRKSPKSVDETVENELGEEIQIGELHKQWITFKENYSTHLMEFDELVYEVEQLGLTPPNKYLVIDEMHDVYPLLHNTINRWINETKEDDNKTVILAGDPRQVINTHQGTKPEFFLDKELPEIQIQQTFRCPTNVWDYAQSILDEEFNYKHIGANKDNGTVESIERINFTKIGGNWNTTGDAYEYYPESIVKKYNKFGTEHKVMFLVRARHQIPAITTQLDKQGVIYDGQHPQSWTQVDDLLDIFNGLYKILYNINTMSKQEFYAVRDVLDEDIVEEHINVSSVGSYVHITDIFSEELQQMKRYKLINHIQLDEHNRDRLNEALINYDEPVYEKDIAVDVRTIHESKGMQAETVVLFNSITDRIKNGIENNEDTRKNECRTWFVGASRSSENLFIIRDSFSSMHPTPFLPEI